MAWSQRYCVKVLDKLFILMSQNSLAEFKS